MRGGDIEGAAALMRVALQNTHDYEFFLRAEAVARKCKAGFGSKRSVRIALLASSTTSLLRSVLELLCLRDGLAAEFYESAFGNYMQELLQPASGLKLFQPDFIVLLLNWRDLGLTGIAADNSECEKAIAWIKNLWRAGMDLPSGKILQLTFSPPAGDPGHCLSSLLPHGRTRAIRRINDAMYDAVQDRVILVDAERMAIAWDGPWEDPLLWSSAKIYPAPGCSQPWENIWFRVFAPKWV